MSYISMPNSAQFSRSASTWVRLSSSRMVVRRSIVVAMLWSGTAIVASGARTRRPARRSPSKACGLVTSWTRWRSMYSRQVPSSASWTTWASQILS